jgi:high-affinity iron transporter
MDNFMQPLILGFREGLEAFLIIAILLKFLEKTKNENFKRNAWYGTCAGVGISFIFGVILMHVSSFIGGTDATAKLWESIASFVAVGLITTFIIWMIKNGDIIKDHIENQAKINLSHKGIFLLAFIMVAREGVEIGIFSFAGKYSPIPIILGLILSIIITFLIYYSLVKIKIKTIFMITLGYLVFQAGFLLGYSIHEALSAAKDLDIIPETHILLHKAFDFSNTQLNHKEGFIGLPLYVLVGWYSKPEWIQCIVQYGYTFLLFFYWYTKKRKSLS